MPSLDETIAQIIAAETITTVMWNVRKARETGWTNAELLRHLRSVPVPGASDNFLTNLDRLVSLASRGLLVPVGLA
jgi:hypothetical protein